MKAKECVAMVMAGGRGRRLGSLTDYYPKPAIHFGGNHRIIDFTLSNCLRSGISAVGMLSQHLSSELHTYIDSVFGHAPESSGIYMLPPRSNECYKGTADAVYKNMKFIERFLPESVLVLSGDHIYNMDYSEMLDFHRETGADITVASTPVPINDAPRFGILSAEENGRVYGFEEKPRRPKSCLASMGIYVFKWSVLKRYLMEDNGRVLTEHDFGRDVFPKMLHGGESMYAYRFDGYWRDVGTVNSLWEASMDQLGNPIECRLPDDQWDSQISHINNMPNYISDSATVHQSIVAGGCSILGKVEHSVLSDSITVGRGSEVVDSVVMPGVYIGNDVKIYNAVIGTGAIIMDNAKIGADDGSAWFVDRSMCRGGVSLISPRTTIMDGMRTQGDSHIYDACIADWIAGIGKGRYSVYTNVPSYQRSVV